ncbi:MAG: FHA domain-containing protein [Nitrosopumilaceae archaeon]
MDCPICNFKNIPADSAYCTECGAKLEESPMSSPTLEPPQQVQPQIEATPQPTPSPPSSPSPQQVTGAVLKLPDDTVIQVEITPKPIGRGELLTYLRSIQNIDPMIVSRQHFTINQENGKYVIEDGKTTVQEKSSANHTYLNGVDITEKGQKELKNGDVIDVANTVKLTFNIQ